MYSRIGVITPRVAAIMTAREAHQPPSATPPSTTPRYKKLSPRNILRWGDEWLHVESGKWMPVYGPATGSLHTVGQHPYGTFQYRRPIKN